MIHVVATIDIVAGSLSAYLDILADLVPLVLAEEGCCRYTPAVDADTGFGNQRCRPGSVTIIEEWETLAHLQAHLQAPHMLAYRQQVADLVQGVELRVLSEA